MSHAEELMREDREKKEAQAAVDRAAPAVRAAIAQLEQPWSVVRYGLDVVPPPKGDPYTPYRVVLERSNGLEHKVVAYPEANTEIEARALATAQCHAGRMAYQEAKRKVATDVLKELGAWEAHNLLHELKAAKQREQEELRIANLQPVATVLGKANPASMPPLNWTDEGRRVAALPPRSGDFVRVLPPQAKKQAQRVINVDGPPDAATLVERRLARTNKF